MCDKLLNCSVVSFPKKLEFRFDKTIVCDSPILSYSGGFFYFFNNESSFNRIANNIASKSTFNRENRKLMNELVGNYCHDLDIDSSSTLCLSKNNRIDGSLRERILSCVPNSSNKLSFNEKKEYYVSAQYFV